MSHGCFNRPPFAEKLWVQDGWTHSDKATSRLPKMIWAPFQMTKDCQFTLSELGQADKRCHGCEHKGGA